LMKLIMSTQTPINQKVTIYAHLMH
jgi:hypothetical protein